MKSPNDWYLEQVGRADMGWNVELSEHEYTDHIAQVQQDAYNQGVEDTLMAEDIKKDKP